MKINKTLLFSVVGILFAGSGWASVQSDIQSDADQIGKWFGQQVAHLTAFNAAANPQLPGDVHSLLGVEVGLSAGVTSSKLDTDAFHSLSLGQLKTSGFDLPSQVPMGMPLIHAKVGLPFSLDLGLKYGHINYNNTTNGAKSEVKNSVFGVEIRRRLIGEGVTGAVLPDVALSVGYDQSNGNVSRTEHYATGLGGGETLDANTTLKSDWTTGAVTARVVASKQFLFLTPYIGGGYSRLMGDANTTMNVVGTASSSGLVNVSSKSKSKADDDILHALGGLQFTFIPTLKLNLGGIYSKNDWGGTAGLVFSFR